MGFSRKGDEDTRPEVRGSLYVKYHVEKVTPRAKPDVAVLRQFDKLCGKVGECDYTLLPVAGLFSCVNGWRDKVCYIYICIYVYILTNIRKIKISNSL